MLYGQNLLVRLSAHLPLWRVYLFLVFQVVLHGEFPLIESLAYPGLLCLRYLA